MFQVFHGGSQEDFMQAIRALISIETYSGNQEAIFGMMDVILNLKAVHLYVYVHLNLDLWYFNN